MIVSGYSRIDTSLRPGSFLSVVYVSKEDGDSEYADEVSANIRADIDSIDGVAVASKYGDPLLIPGLHKLLRKLKMPNRDLMLITSGSDYSVLDDLVGAGYVNYVDLVVDGPLDKSQQECIKILDNCGCPYMVTVEMIPGRISESALKELAGSIDGSKHLILKAGKTAERKFGEKELISLANSVKGAARDVRLIAS
ncbi:MAG: hypothetical protein IKP20_08955 [Candidatus Methanomethylophilaceae archaeon]|nr:hypothetical protein [Candidatus Methanomethylophilaceae archaeon]